MNRYVVTKDNLEHLNAQKAFAPGKLEEELAECEARDFQLLAVTDGVDSWWTFWLSPTAGVSLDEAFKLIKEELKL